MIEPVDPVRTLKKKIWNALKIITAIVLIGFVISRTDVQQVKQTWKMLSQGWLLISVGCFILMTLIKAFQYRALINPKLSFWNVLNIIIMQNAISNFISNTAGVVSYFSMFREEHGVKISRSAVAFIIVKAGDLTAILLILLFSLVIVWSQVEPLHGILLFLCIGIFSALGMFYATVLFRHCFVGNIHKILSWVKLIKYSPVQRVLTVLESLNRQDQSLVNEMLWKSLLFSFSYFAFTLAWFYTIIRAFHIPIEFSALLFISAMLQIISFIPIQVFGGLGVSEFSSLYLYGLFGVAQPEISAALIGIRIYNTLLNAFTLFYIPFGKSRL